MQYTPIIQESYYVVAMEDFLVNNNSIGNHDYLSFLTLIGIPSTVYNTTIVDSGTTLLVLPKNAFNAMVTTFVYSIL